MHPGPEARGPEGRRPEARRTRPIAAAVLALALLPLGSGCSVARELGEDYAHALMLPDTDTDATQPGDAGAPGREQTAPRHWGPTASARTGDCVDLSEDEAVDGASMAVVDCSRLHDAQVFAVQRLPGGGYPDEDAMDRLTEKVCDPAFGTFTGTDYQDSRLSYMPWAATEDEYEDGHRELDCLLVMYDDTRFAGDGRGKSDENQFAHERGWSEPSDDDLYGDDDPADLRL